MNDERDFQRATADWLAAGSDRTPPQVVDAVLLAVRTTHQERDLRIPWRTSSMPNLLRVAAIIAVIAVAGFAALTFVGGGSGVGSVSPPSPSTEPSAASSTAPSAIDTTTWTQYTSDRYGFSIAHPPDWTERPAEDAWTFPDDVNWLSKASEGFLAPQYLVSAWSVPVDSGTSAETWIEDYCALNTKPCTAIRQQGVPVSIDGHDGLLVPFLEDIQAFVLVEDRMYVIAIWQPEGFEPRTRALFEAFVSTVRLLPGGPMPAAPESPPA